MSSYSYQRIPRGLFAALGVPSVAYKTAFPRSTRIGRELLCGRYAPDRVVIKATAPQSATGLSNPFPLPPTPQSSHRPMENTNKAAGMTSAE